MIRKLMVAIAVLGFAGSGALAQEAAATPSVTLKGSAGMGVAYEGATEGVDEMGGMTETDSMIKWISDFDIAMSSSGTTDGGLTFGATASIESNQSGDNEITDSEVFISGESWTIKIGSLDPASNKGQSLGDIGFVGAGVDDLAEIGGTEADVELSFSLGTATLAITAGQTSSDKKVEVTPAVKYAAATYEQVEQTNFWITNTAAPAAASTNKLNKYENPVVFTVSVIGRETFPYITVPDNPTTTTVDEEEIETFYIHTLTQTDLDETTNGHIFAEITDDSNDVGDKVVIKVMGVQDSVTGTANAGDIDPVKAGPQADEPDAIADSTELRIASERRMNYSEETVNGEMLTAEVMAKDAVMKTVTSQDTQWAAGVSFALGSTTVGIGMDSEKLMQASVSADLGAFSGKLFYARQKMDDDMKTTGTGVEIGISTDDSGNTNINAIYAQNKAEMGEMSTTEKGFGVGVSHGLGGGASLAAGFAKVEDQTKASVGVTMSF